MTPKIRIAFGVFIAVGLPVCALLGLWLWLYRDTTTYAPSYDEAAFREVVQGMPSSEVFELLGYPLSRETVEQQETWFYFESSVSVDGVPDEFFGDPSYISFDRNLRVSTVHGAGLSTISPGMTDSEVLEKMGPPSSKVPAYEEAAHYTVPGGSRLFRARIVRIDRKGKVVDTVLYEFYD